MKFRSAYASTYTLLSLARPRPGTHEKFNRLPVDTCETQEQQVVGETGIRLSKVSRTFAEKHEIERIFFRWSSQAYSEQPNTF